MAKVSTKKIAKSIVKAARPSKTFDQKVKAVVNRMAEVKEEIFTYNLTVLNYANLLWEDTCIKPISPWNTGTQISLGSGSGDRVGNEITTQSCTLDIVLYAMPYHATTNPLPQPVEVIIWIFGVRNDNTEPLDIDDFFQDGNGNTNLSGSLIDTVKDYNKDKYIVYKKVIRKLGFSNYGASGNQPNYQTFSNNDYKLNQHIKIDCTKYLPKKVQFNDAASDAVSKGVWYAIQAVPSNGSVIPDPFVLVKGYANQTFKFTDL